MADYIDREKVNFRCSYHGDCIVSGSKCDKCSDNVIDYQELMEVPTADVIERSKINEAIKEIEDLDPITERVGLQVKQEILNILKRNIGE